MSPVSYVLLFIGGCLVGSAARYVFWYRKGVREGWIFKLETEETRMIELTEREASMISYAVGQHGRQFTSTDPETIEARSTCERIAARLEQAWGPFTYIA